MEPHQPPPHATRVVDSTSPTKPSAINCLRYSISGATRAWVPTTPKTPLARASAASSSASGQPVTERPLAVDVLASLDRRLHDFQMMGHLHRDGDDVAL